MRTGFEARLIVVNAPTVVSETIAGEAIIMHHGTGEYFDTLGSGAVIWEAIEHTTTRGGIVARLVAVYGLDPDYAKATSEAFLATLDHHDLIRSIDGTPLALPVVGTRGLPFAEPVLGVHTDLADMLLLDPIHDVDTAGWPSARPRAEAE